MLHGNQPPIQPLRDIVDFMHKNEASCLPFLKHQNLLSTLQLSVTPIRRKKKEQVLKH